MYFIRLLGFFFFVTTSLHSYSYDVKKPPIASERFSFRADGIHATIPYKSNYPLDKKNANVTRLIIAIHSSNHDANYYYKNTHQLASKLGKEKSSLIVAPQLLLDSLIDSPVHADYLYWNAYPFLGSSKATYKNHKARISAYEVLDTLIDQITQSGNFKNLQDIVIFGHSAGGQLVNRYCASSRFEKHGFNIRYVVMAPSSYLYFDDKRPINQNQPYFQKVPIPTKKYNSWGYGLENLYRVHRKYKITPRMMKEQYAKSNVTYLVGSKDNNPNSPSLSKKKAANLQGSHRVERMMFYQLHLQNHFGDAVLNRHKFFVIPNVGHSSKGLMNSKRGKGILFQ